MVTDAEYNLMFYELKQLEKETGFILSNSPTQTVGFEVKSKLNKVQLITSLLSLDDTKQIDEIVKFGKGKGLVAMLKLDGLTVEINESNHQLAQASTRGDGYEGENITHNTKVFKNIPLTISSEDNIRLSGEALIHKNFTYNDMEYGSSLGTTSHHPLHSIAFKFEDEKAKTTLQDVEFSMGRTGALTPVGIFDTVLLDGTEVSRASLHNISIIENLQLGIGDEIEVQKCNMIIPQIVNNLTRSNTLKIPIKCPFCDESTEIVQEKESKVLMCTNDNCSGRLLSKLSHFVSKTAMNIDGLSEAALEKFIEAGCLKTFTDIYRLDEHKDSIIKMDGFGKKSYEKLFSAIVQSKNVKLENFIVALGIPNIGRTASKDISKYFNGDWRLFENAISDGFDFTHLEDFGEIMNNSLHSYFNIFSNSFQCSCLAKIVSFEKAEIMNSLESKIKDLTFVITGPMEHYKNRDELKETIEKIGGKTSGSVSAKTDYLINNDTTSNSSKNQKAKQLGVKIISENDFIEMIKS